jgi:ATP-dependent DNA helicase RecG
MNGHGHSNSARPSFLLSDARRRWTRYRIAEPSQSGEAECSDAKETNLALKSARLSLSGASLAPNPPDSSPKNDEEGFRLSLEEIAAPVAQTSRAKPEVVRNTILLLCSDQFLPITNLASLLHRNGRVLRTNYLAPMVKEGLLRRRFPDDPNHPQQAYKTAQPTPTDS